ncbi:MAG: hypothetical protein WBQ94_05755 [Terracidiphilus sp.]
METSLANPATPAYVTKMKDAVSGTGAAGRILDAPPPLAWWHLTSLDAPTVAVVWTIAFAWAARVALPAWVPALLALAAWSVYIGDRLLDARAARLTNQLRRLRLRHHFHWRHRRILFPLALVSACAAVVLVSCFMPMAAVERNSVLGAAAVAYFSGVHSPRRFRPLLFRLLAKEALVAILFTAACVLPTVSRVLVQVPAHAATALLPLCAMAFFFTLLAWLNCHAIERWESSDAPSLSGVCARALVLASLGLVLAVILVATRSPRAAGVICAGATSAFLLALLDRRRERLSPLALRATADLVLLTPLVALLQ